MIIGSILLLLIAICIILTILSLIAAPLILHLPQFGKSPSGQRLQRINASPNRFRGRFVNRTAEGQKDISLKQYLKIARKFIFGKKRALTPPQPMEMVKRDLKQLDPEKELLVWFGHSSYLLSIHGTTLLVDPTFCGGAPFPFINRAFPGTDRYRPEDLPERIDFLIITHDHYDHLDYNSIIRLKERVRQFICPLGVGAHLEHWGVLPEQITEMDWEEHFSPKPGWEIHCLPAQHFSGRTLKRNPTLWASFLICTPFGNIFAGCDGGYAPHFKEIGRQFPDISLAILENGQYDEHWSHLHTMPSQLAKEVSDLGAKQFVTIHHSKYALAHHDWDEPLQNETAVRDELQVPLIVAKLGEITEIKLS